MLRRDVVANGNHGRGTPFGGDPVGGGKRIRTADPLLAKQVLYQLSYTPELSSAVGVVGLGRFELPTSPLSGVRSTN